MIGNATKLIEDFHRNGVELRPCKDRLLFRPGNRVTPEQRAALLELKPIILRILAERHVEYLFASIPLIVTGADLWARRAAELIAQVSDDDRRLDYRERFERRAHEVRFGGNHSRLEAERLAFFEISQAMSESGDCP